MGEYGSGQRWWKKRAAETCLAIDTADLRRRGRLAPGTRAERVTLPAAPPWRRASEVGCELDVADGGCTLRLRYEAAASGECLDYPVALVTTPCRYGGWRWRFVCPLARGDTGCGRRARKLYLKGRYFGCRHCHDLTYRSRQRSDARAYDLARRGLDAIHPTRWEKVGDLGVMMARSPSSGSGSIARSGSSDDTPASAYSLRVRTGAGGIGG